jgi:hypothetical protein
VRKKESRERLESMLMIVVAVGRLTISADVDVADMLASAPSFFILAFLPTSSFGGVVFI